MIINPDDGPLATSDLGANYAACVPGLKTAGPDSVVLGYVRTNYGNQPEGKVHDDVDTYATWPTSYRPTGIFFDEVTYDAGHVSNYTGYATYARSKGFNFIVFNPGEADADPGYFSSSAADLVVTYEGPYSSSFSTSDLTISPSTPAAKQAVLMYNGPSTSPTALIDRLGSGGVGAVYITDDVLNDDPESNPWDTVPSFWAQEIADVAAA
ncbi:hypothetical protein PENSPDRAFT_644167 [Peniophora sp. CONT]|nr:hypothetical protein PENSPDRAFT_644167 [Peniophora sp. CONT]